MWPQVEAEGNVISHHTWSLSACCSLIHFSGVILHCVEWDLNPHILEGYSSDATFEARWCHSVVTAPFEGSFKGKFLPLQSNPGSSQCGPNHPKIHCMLVMKMTGNDSESEPRDYTVRWRFFSSAVTVHLLKPRALKRSVWKSSVGSDQLISGEP